MQIDQSVRDYLVNSKIVSTPEQRLYVGVRGGGCAGLQYLFEIVNFDSNKYVELDPYVCTDKKSSVFLKDCKLLYKVSVGGSILTIENPQAKQVCGCGTSFGL